MEQCSSVSEIMDQCLESDCEGDFPVSSAPHLGVLRVCNNTKEWV